MWETKKTRLLRAQNVELIKQTEIIKTNFEQFQTAYADRISSTKNAYASYESQVDEIALKFNGESAWGCELVQRIVGLLAAFTMPNGVDLMVDDGTKEKTPKELAYIREWLDDWNLNEGGTLALAVEVNLQGRIAITLDWKKEAADEIKVGQVVPNYVSWADKKYAIENKGASNLRPEFAISWQDKGKPDKTTIPPERLAFMALNSRIPAVDSEAVTGRPRISQILHILDYISQDLSDQRKGNELFGHPTPNFKCESKAEVDRINEMIQNLKWKVGTGIATTAEFTLEQGQGGDPMSKSIQTAIQIVCASTGISPHFLGFPNVLSNRSTADSMGEPMEIVSKAEITIWKRFFDELFDKVITLRNENVEGEKLRTGIVKAKLLPLSDRQWKQITDVWLPLLKEGAISHPTFLSKIPGIDPDDELQKIEDAKPDEALPGESGFGGGKDEIGDDDKRSLKLA